MEKLLEKNLKTAEAAEMLGLSPSWLEKVRLLDPAASPPFVRHGRSVRYPEAALRAWLAGRIEGGTR